MIEKRPLGLNPIPHSRPTLGPEEIKAVSDVIASGNIAGGRVVEEFEKRFARYLNAGYAVSTSSGTSALHLTLLAMGVGPGDEVVIPSYVCSALLNAINYTGATPILAEIAPDTYNLDPDDVKRRLTKHTKAVVVPHLFGMPADLDRLLELNVRVIEDCAQAVGSTYRHRPLGTFGDAAIFSFYATKVITTGEGGMVVSNSNHITDRISDLKTYDKKKDYKIRFNCKMTDIQAAMGLVQLERLESFIQRRKAIAEQYFKAFRACGLTLPPAGSGHIYFRFVLGLKTDSMPWIRRLHQKGIGGDRPIHTPLHRHLKLPGYPVTDKAWKQSLSIPIYPDLTDEQADNVIDAVIAAVDEFCD